MPSEEQIQRFFAKQCNADEAEQVAAWLQAHPEEAAAYLEEAEWQEAPDDERAPEEVYAESWQQIQKTIRSRKRHVLLKRSAIAACIAGGIAAGVFYWGKKGTAPTGEFSASVPAPAVNATTADTEYNLTSKPRRIAMTDGSLVSLSPQSVVWFDTPFARINTRDIHLRGEARFEVAKNRQKPFTVYAGSLSTTALGTAFIVKEQLHAIRVQLMHGKVVIKNTDRSASNWQNVYLLPGQQMIYNMDDAVAKVDLIEENGTAGSSRPVAKLNMQRETADSLLFNGSPMNTVLQKLHSYYNVRIDYNKKDIKHISFTGVIVKKDSVQTILKVLTQMNGLSVANTDSSFIISKEKD